MRARYRRRHGPAVYEGEVFAAARADALLIDCSTIDVATAQRTAAADRKLQLIDAPVSGGTAAANAAR